MKMISDANPEWKFLNIEICGTWPPAFASRLAKEEKNTEWDWWDGLVPPFPTE